MTIDYKALADQLTTLSERLLDSEEHAVDSAIPPIAEEVVEELQPVVTMMIEMADAKPVAWMYEYDGCVDHPVLSARQWPSYGEPWTETPLYAAPASPQAMEDANVWKQIVPDDEPQAEPKREPRPCTCHPDDNPPVPCAQKYALNECRATRSGPDEAQHPDDAAVDRFAAAMKAKLAEKRAEGRGGWDDPEQCSTTYLAMLLRGHVEKGDPLDVGNFAMMLWNRGGATNEAIDVGIPDLRLTEAQSTIAERRLHHALDELDHGIVANDVREVLDELAVLRAALATRETK